MEISYKRKHSESFMMISGADLEESYEVKMIEKNEIRPLLSMSNMKVDGQEQIFYNISKMESLKDYLEADEIDKEKLQRIFINMHLGLEEIGKYLINQNHILFSEDTIFVERSNESFNIRFCYCPFVEEEPQIQLRRLIEWMLTMKAEDVYEIYDLCQKDDFTLMELVEVLSDKLPNENTEAEAAIAESRPKIENVELDDDLESLFAEEKKPDSFIKQLFTILFKKSDDIKATVSKKREQSVDFIVDPGMDFTEPTVLIKPEELPCTGKLLYDGNELEDNYMVSGECFRIGTATNNHGVLHSKAVSRHHAKIFKKGEDYFLEDLNSTNGSYLNGKIVEYRNPVKLKAMDQIRLADVSYVFM